MVGARVEREDPIVIGQVKSAFLEPEMKVAGFQYFAVLVTENRKQHLIAERLFEWVPIDVKKLGKPGAWTVFQDIHPPLVLRIDDPHVVRNEIGNLPHPVLLQGGDHGIEVFSCPDREVQFIVVTNVVPMIAVWARAKERRAVDVADPKFLKIRDNFGRIFETEMSIEL